MRIGGVFVSWWREGACAVLCAGAFFAAAAAEPIAVTMHEPRAYGHVVGDLVERHARFELPDGASLAADALPRRGRVDAWLELREAELRRPGLGGATRELRLVYQIVNAPRQVETVELPALSLALAGSAAGAAPQAVEIDAWPIAVAALTPQDVIGRAGLDVSQPDIAPERAALAPMALRLVLWLSLLAVLLYALALPRWPQLAFWRRRAPLHNAWLALRRIDRHRNAASYRAALARLHAAFDATAGVAVFEQRLEPLYAAQPRLRAVSAQVERVFHLSRHEFFAGDAAPTQDLRELLALARTLAQAEGGA